MRLSRLVLVSLAAVAAFGVGPAVAGDPPLHPCQGHIDYACTDGSGALCTVWLDFRCQVGLA